MIRLKELRNQFNLSQLDIARQFNVAQNTVSNWENGNRVPDAEMLRKIADYFNVSIDWLIGIEAQTDEIRIARQRTKELCEERDPQISDIENTFKTNYATFRSWYNGYGDYFNDKIYLLADFFNCSTDYLFGKTDNPASIDDQLANEKFALFGEVHDLTDEEKQRVLDFIKFTKSQRKDD